MNKDAGLRVRVEREIRDQFVDICRLEGEKASAVIRDFMQRYIDDRSRRFQPDLFPSQGGGE